jgi:hypothetical protein
MRSCSRSVGIGMMLGLIMFGLAGSAFGTTIRVENNGVDTSPCGTVTTPCRSISWAIFIGTAGDTILVGPGSYGDLDGNGGWSPGEEHQNFECDCMVEVNKAVRILSTAGAASTVIFGSPDVDTIVRITAAVEFGRKSHGFTVTGVSTIGVAPVIKYGVDTSGAPAGTVVAGNVAVSFNQSGFRTSAGQTLFADNRSQGSGAGFFIQGGTHTLRRNIATTNLTGFFITAPNAVLVQNAATANTDGYVVNATGTQLIGGSAIGNKASGIDVIGGSPPTIDRYNIYGNSSPSPNCGVILEYVATITVSNSYWGALTGPGPDPADQPCVLDDGSAIVVDGFLTKPVSVPVTALK